MNTMAMRWRCCKSASKVRICAWTVTSRAVVGSSANSTWGFLAMAMAISTRCAMPPESSWGQARSRALGSGMPTSASSAAASALLLPRGMASLSWWPTVRLGLRLARGSWKIIANVGPNRLRRTLELAVSRSQPPTSRRWASMAAWSGSRPMTASVATVLPEPDSPTMAVAWPGCKVRSKCSRTLVQVLCLERKATDSSLMASTCSWRSCCWVGAVVAFTAGATRGPGHRAAHRPAD